MEHKLAFVAYQMRARHNLRGAHFKGRILRVVEHLQKVQFGV